MSIVFKSKHTPSPAIQTLAAALTGKELLSEKQIAGMSVPVPPARCGVYFLLRKGRVVYVGQSTHIDARVADHRKAAWRVFDSFSYILCEKDQLNTLESLYIHLFLPEENGHVGKSNKIHAPIGLFDLFALMPVIDGGSK